MAATYEDIQTVLDVLLRLEKAFPETVRLEAPIVWRLRLLNEIAESTVSIMKDSPSNNSISGLDDLWEALHHWTEVAKDACFPETSVAVRSSALLEDLFQLVYQPRTTCVYEPLSDLPDYHRPISSFSLSPDGTKLIAGKSDGSIHIWDLLKRSTICSMHDQEGSISSVTFSADGTHIASGSHDKTVQIYYDAAIGKKCMALSEHQGSVLCVAFSFSASMLVSGSADKKAIIWNCITGKPRFTLNLHTEWVYAVAFSKNEQLVATGSGDRTVCIWDVTTGRLLRKFDTQHSGKIEHLDFLMEGANRNHILSRDSNWAQKYWKAPDYNLIYALSQLEETDFDSASPLFTFNSRTRYLLCWTTETRAFRPVLRLPEHIKPDPSLFCFAGNTLVFLDQSWDGHLYMMDYSSMITYVHILIQHSLVNILDWTYICFCRRSGTVEPSMDLSVSEQPRF